MTRHVKDLIENLNVRVHGATDGGHADGRAEIVLGIIRITLHERRNITQLPNRVFIILWHGVGLSGGRNSYMISGRGIRQRCRGCAP